MNGIDGKPHYWTLHMLPGRFQIKSVISGGHIYLASTSAPLLPTGNKLTCVRAERKWSWLCSPLFWSIPDCH